ncbi:hypothetical protein FF36_01903 [Frankia torreyi]|uniref:Uncharacterized protein n=1 Tax=Frankia torreyi TaxID=1856 RepID=A0A0D8BHJ8_9ACTN|nr:hypothetical protein FF36_01903 [Frankia torreyi]KQM05670.1 hypothetical protein FF86_101488 [Frankia sp. CpI1-P]
MGLIDWIAAGPARSARRTWARADRDQARDRLRDVTDGKGLTPCGTPTRAPMPTCERCGQYGRPLTVRHGRAVCRARC